MASSTLALRGCTSSSFLGATQCPQKSPLQSAVALPASSGRIASIEGLAVKRSASKVFMAVATERKVYSTTKSEEIFKAAKVWDLLSSGVCCLQALSKGLCEGCAILVLNLREWVSLMAIGAWQLERNIGRVAAWRRIGCGARVES